MSTLNLDFDSLSIEDKLYLARSSSSLINDEQRQSILNELEQSNVQELQKLKDMGVNPDSVKPLDVTLQGFEGALGFSISNQDLLKMKSVLLTYDKYLDTVKELTKIKYNVLEISYNCILENNKSIPVSERNISSAEIIQFADKLIEYLKN
jgi:hypothetical protein